MSPRIVLLLCLLAGAVPRPSLASGEPVTDQHLQVVHRYIAAFNAHDTEAMLALVTDDVQWLLIDGQTVATETNNKEELRKGMNDYFKSCASCRSRLAQVFSSNSRVSALEVASYQNSKGQQEQRSVSVYEFSDGLIRRVYYFPVEK